jgi:plastocyanin
MILIVVVALLFSACVAAPPTPAPATAVQAPTNVPVTPATVTQASPSLTPAQAPTLVPQAKTPATTVLSPVMTPTPKATSVGGGTRMVSLKNTAYNPRSITVRAGTILVWENDEASAIPHTVTAGAPNAPSGAFDSGTLNPTQKFQFTLTTPGTFNYFCRIHGAAMTGVVVVTP